MSWPTTICLVRVCVCGDVVPAWRLTRLPPPPLLQVVTVQEVWDRFDAAGMRHKARRPSRPLSR